MKLLIIILLTFSLNAIDFSADISPIIYNNCTSCHRTGQIGSFLPLTNYDEVFINRHWIADAISGNDDSRHGDPIMPPWPADRNYSTLLDEIFLTEEEIHIFLDWIELGAIAGNLVDEHPMPEFPEGSSIGIPDFVFEMETSYSISGNYEDDYRCFVIKTNLNESIDLAAMEFIPGNLEAVHHAIMVAVPSGAADALDNADPEYGYECFGDFGIDNISDFLGGYTPGLRIRQWPEGLAQQIPANSDLIMQVHYAPLNTAQSDKSYLNIFIKDEPVDRYIQEELMVNYSFVLPPNQLTEVSSTWNITNDISLIQFLPHSHLLGKTWEIFAEKPNNEVIPLIRINEWDFDWQFWYSPEYMVHLPAGSVIHASCIYDNTIDNPDNPNDPPEWTYWGDGTTDEMFFVPFRYIEYQEGDENIYLGNDLAGDLNEDGGINVLDIVVLVNCVLEANCTDEADINSDHGYNVLDIVALVNMVLSN